MQETANLLKLLSDSSRLRILLLLRSKELCVCQIMGVLRMSQPLVSKNLSMLKNAGLLKSRKDGKLAYYSISRRLKQPAASIIESVASSLKADRTYLNDLSSLTDCEEFQRETGKCGMEGLREFMRRYEKKR
ncbi:MAG: metalloregulator ArsR/SmtB family transcription factor [Nitrospiraceae bacterium]|nr:metalloregulator ArsR/SmtB family transcription factor [Nitrospiraceae bacterium]